MAIAAIDAIDHPGQQYGCLKKRLDLRIAASEVDFRWVKGVFKWKKEVDLFFELPSGVYGILLLAWMIYGVYGSYGINAIMAILGAIASC